VCREASWIRRAAVRGATAVPVRSDRCRRRRGRHKRASLADRGRRAARRRGMALRPSGSVQRPSRDIAQLVSVARNTGAICPVTSLSRDDWEAKRGRRRFLGWRGPLSHYGLTPAFSGHVRRVFLTQSKLLSPSIARRWIIRRRSWIDGRRLQVVQLLLVQLPGDVTA